jgi:DNA invertase Pin-like site-specific DNA recombinase
VRLDAYIRVSKVAGRAGDSFISPDVQRTRIEQWAALRDVEIAQWHQDLDVSGGTLRRAGLDALMARVRDGSTGGLVVANLDRLSRAGVADALKLVEEVHDAGGHVAAVDLGVDPTTPTGELMLTLLLALARMQRRQIAAAWHEASGRAVGRGVHTVLPYGYRRGDDKRLVPDDVKADAVRRIFELRGAGHSWKAITDAMNASAHRPMRAGFWSLPAIKRIVSSRAYVGEAFYGEHRMVGTRRSSPRTLGKPHKSTRPLANRGAPMVAPCSPASCVARPARTRWRRRGLVTCASISARCAMAAGAARPRRASPNTCSTTTSKRCS